MTPVCPRCNYALRPGVIVPNGLSLCATCEPQDASVLDFLYQFPRAAATPHVVRLGDWFFAIHESSFVAVHDSEWPTLYESETVIGIDAGRFPGPCAYFDLLLRGPCTPHAKLRMSELRQVADGKATIRFFEKGFELQPDRLKYFTTRMFGQVGCSSLVDLGHSGAGVRIAVDGLVLVLPVVSIASSDVVTLGV